MMTVDPDRHINPTSTVTNLHKDHLPVHNQHPGQPKDRRYNQVTIDDPSLEYYSSDNQDSDSEG